MSNALYNDYDERLLPASGEEDVDANVDENSEVVTEKTDESDEYYELPLAIKSRSLIWAVIAFAFGILSLALCPFYYVSLVFAAGSVAASLVSRKNLGFFERYSIIGLVLGMMGVVCGIFSAIVTSIGIFK